MVVRPLKNMKNFMLTHNLLLHNSFIFDMKYIGIDVNDNFWLKIFSVCKNKEDL